LLVLLTFHEFGHAWMAWKCGDDTAQLQGRVSLNPIVHIDLLGAVILPLLMVLLPGAGRFLIVWVKPVPVDPANLRKPKIAHLQVTLGGPWMTLLLAIVLMGLRCVGTWVHYASMEEVCFSRAHLSLLFCFFNLLPTPPLDGSQIVRTL